jgi:UDP-N-acetylglucosamine 2-epimerase (non-hydrolysing)
MITPIGILFGTRPEYLKCKPLLDALQAANIEFRILHINQHKDLTIEEEYSSNYTKIHLPQEIGVSRLNELASVIPKSLEDVIQSCNSILVQGDTATAFFGALCAFHLSKPIFHLEAGLRTYDLQNPFPEEAYRSMISKLSTYHLCPDIEAVKNLNRENIHTNIHIVGNTILDLLKSYTFTSRLTNRVLITIHRRENWDTLCDIAEAIRLLSTEYPELEFDWVLHPNPIIANKIKDYFSGERYTKNIHLYNPLSHKELSKKIYEAYCIFTDSGGIQEEASFAGKFIFVFRKVTERSSIPQTYIQLIEAPTDLFSVFPATKISLLEPCYVYGNGDASQKIVEIIRSVS